MMNFLSFNDRKSDKNLLQSMSDFFFFTLVNILILFPSIRIFLFLPNWLCFDKLKYKVEQTTNTRGAK